MQDLGAAYGVLLNTKELRDSLIDEHEQVTVLCSAAGRIRFEATWTRLTRFVIEQGEFREYLRPAVVTDIWRSLWVRHPPPPGRPGGVPQR